MLNRLILILKHITVLGIQRDPIREIQAAENAGSRSLEGSCQENSGS